MQMSSSVSRITRLKACIRDAGVDAVVCFNPANVCYLSNGFIATITSHPIVAVLTLQVTLPALLVHISLKFLAYQLPGHCAVFYYGSSDGDVGDTTDWKEGLDKVLARASVGRDATVGIESDIATDRRDYLEQNFPDIEFTPIGPLLQRCRAIKDKYEISNCQKAAEIAKAGMAMATTKLQDGSSELEAIQAAKAQMHTYRLDHYPRDNAMGLGSPKSGGTCSPFVCYALTDSRKFLLATSPTNQKPQNQTVLVWCIAAINSYHATIARTIAVGQTPALDARMLRHLCEILPYVISQIRPDVSLQTVYLRAHDLLREKKYDPPDEIGYLTGLEPHEAVALDAGTNVKFQPGMVFVLKLSIAISPTAKVEISDTIVVMDHGYEYLA